MEEDPRLIRRRKRIRAFTLYGVAFAVWFTFVGLPQDVFQILLWLWLASICWYVDRPIRHHLGFLRDWLPLGAALIIYDISRGHADNGAVPHVKELVAADRWLFDGQIPTIWLQERFYDPDTIQWWDALASWIYFSHFVAAPTVAFFLWVRNRDLWARFTRRWLTLIAAGLATYFLYPAAPPWWAANDGLIGPVARISTRGWKALGLHGAGHLLSRAQELGNPIAAVPSLHSAFALLIVAFFLPRVRRRWWPLLMAYPVAMALTLIYSGEHWVIDAMLGWAYVIGVYLVVGIAERLWARARSGRDTGSGPDEEAGPDKDEPDGGQPPPEPVPVNASAT